MLSKEELLDFNKEIIYYYEQGKIKAPCHFSGGNEEQLIQFFKEENINKDTWIFSTWRSHYHWLLSGRDSEELKQQILDGHSMHIFGHKFFTSAIVAGIAPIALGVAYALKLKKSTEKVYCFLGCMAATTGLANECYKYAAGHNLPIIFVIEDNNRCVRANTRDLWGNSNKPIIKKYKYLPTYPHAGSGKYIMF